MYVFTVCRLGKSLAIVLELLQDLNLELPPLMMKCLLKEKDKKMYVSHI
jgi:hypothetical protein